MSGREEEKGEWERGGSGRKEGRKEGGEGKEQRECQVYLGNGGVRVVISCSCTVHYQEVFTIQVHSYIVHMYMSCTPSKHNGTSQRVVR